MGLKPDDLAQASGLNMQNALHRRRMMHEIAKLTIPTTQSRSAAKPSSPPLTGAPGSPPPVPARPANLARGTRWRLTSQLSVCCNAIIVASLLPALTVWVSALFLNAQPCRTSPPPDRRRRRRRRCRAPCQMLRRVPLRTRQNRLCALPPANQRSKVSALASFAVILCRANASAL